ncbi:MAG: helix-turn-helix transcriptional regulator [Bacteroidales bacterium]|nr:helix-turn-helix transcriptional regulator [Bacteroidales bacterium]
MNEADKSIIRNLVGEFSQSQLDYLQENIEFHLHQDISLFVPLFNACEYAISENHSHPSYSFIYSLKINGYLIVEGKKIESLRKDNVAIAAFSPGIEHQEVTENGFSNYIAIFVKEDFFNTILKTYKGIDSIHLPGVFFPADETLLHLLKLFMTEINETAETNNTYAETLNKLIVLQIIKNIFNVDTHLAISDNQTKIDRAILFMNKELENQIKVETIAHEVGLSTSHFTKLFKEAMKKTPIEYLTILRVEKAKKIMKISNKNLSEIAFECGFSSPSYFTKCFVSIAKQQPGEYRKKFVK